MRHIWTNVNDINKYIKGFEKENTIVVCGTHDCAPEVTKSFITNVLQNNYHELPVPGDGEPNLYIVGSTNVNPNRILAAWENWYIDGCESEQMTLQRIDTEYNYGLNSHLDYNNHILFIIMMGDTKYYDDDDNITKFRELVIGNGGLILSEATLRDEDLLASAYDLMTVNGLNKRLCEEICKVFSNEPTVSNVVYMKSGIIARLRAKAGYLFVDNVYNYFNDIAPEGYRFGTSEGDGSCFGWFKEVDNNE